jgi:hypothetical protein
LLTVALDRHVDVVVPSAALAELYRGEATDAAIDTVLTRRGMSTVTSGRCVVRSAGALRHRERLDSCHVVDRYTAGRRSDRDGRRNGHAAAGSRSPQRGCPAHSRLRLLTRYPARSEQLPAVLLTDSLPASGLAPIASSRCKEGRPRQIFVGFGHPAAFLEVSAHGLDPLYVLVFVEVGRDLVLLDAQDEVGERAQGFP